MAAIVVVDIIILNQILFRSYKYCLNVVATIVTRMPRDGPPFQFKATTHRPIVWSASFHSTADKMTFSRQPRPVVCRSNQDPTPYMLIILRFQWSEVLSKQNKHKKKIPLQTALVSHSALAKGIMYWLIRQHL